MTSQPTDTDRLREAAATVLRAYHCPNPRIAADAVLAAIAPVPSRPSAQDFADAIRARLYPENWHPSEYDKGTAICERFYDRISRAAGEAACSVAAPVPSPTEEQQ